MLRLRQEQGAPRLVGNGPGGAGVEHDSCPLLEGHRDSQVSPHLHLVVARPRHQQLTGRERANGLGQHLIRGLLQEVHDRIPRGELGQRVGAKQDRPGVDQVDHGRDQAPRRRPPAPGSLGPAPGFRPQRRSCQPPDPRAGRLLPTVCAAGRGSRPPSGTASRHPHPGVAEQSPTAALRTAFGPVPPPGPRVPAAGTGPRDPARPRSCRRRTRSDGVPRSTTPRPPAAAEWAWPRWATGTSGAVRSAATGPTGRRCCG